MSSRRGWTVAPDGVERVVELADYEPDLGLPRVVTVEGRAYPFGPPPGMARWTSWMRVTAGDAVEFPLGGHRARIERRILLPGLTLSLRLWWLQLTRGGVRGFLAAVLDEPGRSGAAHWWLYELRVDDVGLGFLVLTAVGARIPGGKHALAWRWSAVPAGVAPPAPGVTRIGTWAGRDWEALAEDLVVHPDAPAGADGAGDSATSDGTSAPALNTLRDTASPNVTRRRG